LTLACIPFILIFIANKLIFFFYSILNLLATRQAEIEMPAKTSRTTINMKFTKNIWIYCYNKLLTNNDL
jgi:hypothetical protein